MIKRMTSEEKADFIRGCLQGHIFTSSMIPDHQWIKLVPTVFMPIAMGCLDVGLDLPKKESLVPEEIPDDMSAEEFDRLHNDKDKIFARYERLKDQLQKEFNDQLGIVWEYYCKAYPKGVNGYPVFMSCNLMHKEDWEEVLPVLQEKQKMLNDIVV